MKYSVNKKARSGSGPRVSHPPSQKTRGWGSLFSGGAGMCGPAPGRSPPPNTFHPSSVAGRRKRLTSRRKEKVSRCRSAASASCESLIVRVPSCSWKCTTTRKSQDVGRCGDWSWGRGCEGRWLSKARAAECVVGNGRCPTRAETPGNNLIVGAMAILRQLAYYLSK
jgi:hypothetical protein